ncbi:hypothetical protein MferCBS31731_006534 [Microsporum ferrugineum]
MELEKVPFSSPASVSLCMASFFRGYMSYAPNSFSFEWLERTPDLEVKCKDFTGEKFAFSTSPELLKAIRSCQRINDPDEGGWLPSDWGFSGFLTNAAHQAVDKVLCTKYADFDGPLFGTLGASITIESNPRIKGVQLFYLKDNHWSCVMRDWTCYSEEQVDRKDHIRKSELLAATSIFCRQMNVMTWDPDRKRYKAKSRYRGGILTATIVTCICAQVRIVQATLNPSEKYPTLTYTLRAIYDLNKKNYDKEAAFTAVQWILSPPDPVARGAKAK